MQGGARGGTGFLPGPSDSAPFTSTGLTAGFNHDWLAQRLDAGSANGAAIGGIGKNPGGGKVATKDDGKDIEINEKGERVTTKNFGDTWGGFDDPSDMKGASRLMD